MGEKQDEVEKNNEGEKKNEGGGGGGPTTVVLKFDLHCDGCVKKIKHSLRKTFDGVETVKGDVGSNKLTVIGTVDPSKIKEKVEQKIKKKVELISPKPNKEGGEKKGNDEKKLSDENKPEVKLDAKNLDEKDNKLMEAPVSTVVLKTNVHCDGCAQKIRNIVAKRDGVKEVDVDLQKDTIRITGTMNMNELLSYLNVKLKRVVYLSPLPKKDEGDKKSKEGGSVSENLSKKPKENDWGRTENPKEGGGENPSEKPREDGGVGTEKFKEGGGGNPPEKSKDDKGDKKKANGEKNKEVKGGEENFVDGTSEVDISRENTTRMEINKMKFSGYPHGGYNYKPEYGYNYTYEPRQYDERGSSHHMVQYNWHEQVNSHPPQIFSDENPNACSVM